ncbi:MAG: hypothetical protein CMK09_03035 [Ponticaulis sp.]|nr:hypothetical protein [Ponticaulis sp.]
MICFDDFGLTFRQCDRNHHPSEAFIQKNSSFPMMHMQASLPTDEIEASFSVPGVSYERMPNWADS